MINTNTPTEIDSLKVRIPYRNVEIIDYKLEATWYTAVEGGEDYEEFKKNALLFDDDGIKTRFAIETMPTDSKGNKKKYLTIGFNSKLLKNRYFEGITKYNIELIHDELMIYNVAKFSLQTLLESFATDIDFKTDTKCSFDDFTEIRKHMILNARSSNRTDIGYKSFTKKTNQGIQFSDRATTSFKTNPFFKMYWKSLELRNKSKKFYQAHLKGQDVDNIARFETTIKNNEHLKALKITSNTLSHLLNLEDSVKKDILQKTTNIHIDSSIKKMKPKEGMNPMDLLLHNLIVMQMKQGMSFDKITDFALSNFTDKVAKSRKKSHLKQIYNEHIQGTKKDISTKAIASIFNIIGINNEID
tara:strand:+ start:56 stop:1129 length:1074 start_codon:yes stop_codon:yes gene_type:complete